METRTVISIEGLSKRYRIGVRKARGEGLRHVLEQAARRSMCGLLGKREQKPEDPGEFWALRDLDLRIEAGETVGVIGRNGAGKSTLLKLLSRITEPTSGRIRLRGRVASLLEVGTGFHPELTGRENIFLNGAVLGMRRGEIRRKFDEIAAFSGIGRFLDTPVKRYSSGMYVRLAFAVAAHLEPDILIVDEVLAVGDADFQRKCLGKMEDVSRKEGRTVILVSHQMPAVQNLCRRCVLMENGSIAADGPTRAVLARYLEGSSSLASQPPAERADRTGRGGARLVGVGLHNRDGSPVHEVMSGRDVVVRISYETTGTTPLEGAVVCVDVCREMRTYFMLSTELSDPRPLTLAGKGWVDFLVPDWPLGGGEYQIHVYIGSPAGPEDYLEDAATIRTQDGDFYGTGRLHHPGWEAKSVLVRHSWNHSRNQPSPNRAPALR